MKGVVAPQEGFRRVITTSMLPEVIEVGLSMLENALRRVGEEHFVPC